MKAWKGLELEGADKGIVTLFVKDNCVDGNLVISLLDKNPDCTRLYLGAGRLDVNDEYEISKLLIHCDKKDIAVIVEVSSFGLEKLPELLFEDATQVIVRIDNPKFESLSDNDVIKIDDGKMVCTVEIEDMISTSLSNLHKDMFSTDTLVYDDTQGGYTSENNTCANRKDSN